MHVDDICRMLYRFIEHIPATNEQKLAVYVCVQVVLLVLLFAHPPTWNGVTAFAHRLAKFFILGMLVWLGYLCYQDYGTRYQPNADLFIFDFIFLGSVGLVSYGIALGLETLEAYLKGTPAGMRELYHPSQGIPSVSASQKKVHRIQELTRRVDAETEYLESARRNVKAKALIKLTKQLAKKRA